MAAWTKSFVAGDQDQTADVLRRMLDTFRTQFTYRARDAEGTQSPGETLRTRSEVVAHHVRVKGYVPNLNGKPRFDGVYLANA